MKKTFWFAFILISVLRLSGQQAESSDVFAPFVSRLAAEVQDTGVLLTWRDSADVSGWNLIYRHSEDIKISNIDNASLVARIAPGQQSYIDRPPDTLSYYYAVLVESDDGTRYSLLIPFRNKTIAGVQVPFESDPEKRASRITELTSSSTGDSISVSFKSSRTDREVLLIRSSSEISDFRDLIEGVSWILSPGVTTYDDKPPAGIGYYYAVLDAEMAKLGRVSLIPGANATPYPVQLPLGNVQPEPDNPGSLRTLPLPFLIISKDVESGEILGPRLYLPETVKINQETQAAVDKLISGLPTVAADAKHPEVLPVDKGSMSDGQAVALKSIVEDNLLIGEYEKAQEDLQKYLKIRRTDDLESRARFYLGQAFYFQDRYRKALMEFLLARDNHYLKVRGWLDACFEELASADDQLDMP